MITYGLGTFTNYPKNNPNTPETPSANINIPIALSREEYDNLVDAATKVGGIFRYAAMFNTTIWNYKDLVDTVNAYLQAFVRKDRDFLADRDITLNINKDVLNVLTSFRFYTDYTEKNLQEDYGKDSVQTIGFGQYCSNEYDNNFSYRFVYHLRNYAQHKGLVVNSINFDKHLDEEDNRTVRHSLRIYINQKDIIEDKKFKKEIKIELTDYSEKIDVMEHLSKWMSSLTRIHNQIIRSIVPTGPEYANFIIDQARKLNYDKDNNQVVPIISAINHPNENIKDINNPSFIPLPIEDAQRIIEYCQKVNNTPDNT